jgi:hypothetical protein
MEQKVTPTCPPDGHRRLCVQQRCALCKGVSCIPPSRGFCPWVCLDASIRNRLENDPVFADFSSYINKYIN